jgi:hypothetical protein
MLTDQHFFWSARSVSEAKGQVPSQTSAEYVGAYPRQPLLESPGSA